VEAAALEIGVLADQGAGHPGAGVPADEFSEEADSLGVGEIARGVGVVSVAGHLTAFDFMPAQVAEGQCGVGMPVHHPDHDVEPARLQPVVRGQEAQKLSPGLETGKGEMLDKLQMAGGPDESEPGVADVRQEGRASVRRVVVRDDDFEAGMRLDQCALDAAAKVFLLLIEDGKDEGEQGIHAAG